MAVNWRCEVSGSFGGDWGEETDFEIEERFFEA